MTQAAARSGKSKRAGAGAVAGAYAALYRTSPVDRINIIQAGMSAAHAKKLLDLPLLGRARALQALNMPTATFNKKVKADARLSPAESERVVGFARLIGQVEAMIDEAGDPSGFDARPWLARWLTEPLPALGHARPIDFMNTMEGQNLVSQTLAQVASGAYA